MSTYSALPAGGGPEDYLRYAQGYAVGRSYPGDPVQDKYGPWYRAGQSDGIAALSPRYIRSGTGGVATRQPADPGEYWRGYEAGSTKYTVADVTGLVPKGDYESGVLDGALRVNPRLAKPASVPQSQTTTTPILERRPDGTVIVNPPPPLKPGEKPSPVITGSGTRQPPILRPAPVFDYRLPPLPPSPRFRYLDLFVSILGRPVPLDRLYDLEKLGQINSHLGMLDALAQALAKVQILGDLPGDNREGYRLSGPRGPIAKFVSGLEQMGELTDPRAFGLSAWVGTRTQRGLRGGARGGIRLLTARELRALGFDPLSL